jgi:hypothetical protein
MAEKESEQFLPDKEVLPDKEDKSPNGSRNEYIDKLTLEMFMNKSHYYKYLSKADPTKFEKKAKHRASLRRHAVDIVDLTSKMIENPDDAPTTEVAEAFDDYVKTLMKYLEMRRDDDADQDTLFDPKHFG